MGQQLPAIVSRDRNISRCLMREPAVGYDRAEAPRRAGRHGIPTWAASGQHFAPRKVGKPIMARLARARDKGRVVVSQSVALASRLEPWLLL
jgi:hypothetical protein